MVLRYLITVQSYRADVLTSYNRAVVLSFGGGGGGGVVVVVVAVVVVMVVVVVVVVVSFCFPGFRYCASISFKKISIYMFAVVSS